MSRVILIISAIVFLFSLSLVGCRSKQPDNQVEQAISELSQKEEELKNIGVPSFITQEQAKMDKEEKTLPIPELSVSKEELSREMKTEAKDRIAKEELVSKEVVPLEVRTQVEQLSSPEVKPLSESMPREMKTQVIEKKEVKGREREVKVGKYPPKSYTKVYFSYRNGYDYVSKDKPCKITTVLFASEEVWYADYNVYAVPLSKAKEYKKYLIQKYLVGIGRNISVVEGRSQLTVYWSGINIAKKPLPKGKYIIVTSTHLKNKNKKIIGKIVKVLGKEKPLVVVLK